MTNLSVRIYVDDPDSEYEWDTLEGRMANHFLYEMKEGFEKNGIPTKIYWERVHELGAIHDSSTSTITGDEKE